MPSQSVRSLWPDEKQLTLNLNLLNLLFYWLFLNYIVNMSVQLGPSLTEWLCQSAPIHWVTAGTAKRATEQASTRNYLYINPGYFHQELPVHQPRLLPPGTSIQTTSCKCEVAAVDRRLCSLTPLSCPQSRHQGSGVHLHCGLVLLADSVRSGREMEHKVGGDGAFSSRSQYTPARGAITASVRGWFCKWLYAFQRRTSVWLALVFVKYFFFKEKKKSPVSTTESCLHVPMYQREIILIPMFIMFFVYFQNSISSGSNIMHTETQRGARARTRTHTHTHTHTHHDYNKIAPCGMIKVFLTELNWTHTHTHHSLSHTERETHTHAHARTHARTHTHREIEIRFSCCFCFRFLSMCHDFCFHEKCKHQSPLSTESGINRNMMQIP